MWDSARAYESSDETAVRPHRPGIVSSHHASTAEACGRQAYYPSEVLFAARAVLFDFDGVIVDSLPAWEEAWLRWGSHIGLDSAVVDDYIRTHHGHGVAQVAKALKPDLTDDEARAAAATISVWAQSSPASVLPGAKEHLHELRLHQWTIVSSAPASVVRARLDEFGLPQPAVVIGGEAVENPKPAPDAYLRAAAALGVKPEHCIVIEDATAGVEAARAAGMPVIALRTTYRDSELRGANAIVHDLSWLEISSGETDVLIKA